MGALDEFLGGSGVSRSDPAFQIPREKQRKMDQGRMEILQQELADEQQKLAAGDPRAQANIDAIKREMGSSKAAPVSTSALDDFLSGVEEPAKPAQVRVEVRGGQQPQQVQQPRQVQQMPEAQAPSVADKLIGLGELGLTAVTGTVAPVIGGVAGIAKNVLGGTLGTQEGLKQAEKTAGEVSEALTYQPRTEAGKAVTGKALGALQEAFEASKLPPVMPEALPAAGISKKPGAKAELETTFAKKVSPVAKRIEPVMAPVTPEARQAVREMRQPEMAGVGAAKTANAAILEEAKARATPELRAELDKIKPNEISVDALNRQLDADQLPVPVRLTKGQALQDPVLISRERNERGLKEQYAQFLNQQNKDLQESANLMRERVAPDVNTIDYVADAENTIDLMKNRIKADDAKITEAYNALKEHGAGKLEVDSQGFANSAFKALSEGDEAEFLPPVILNRLRDYKDGKSMNFNQFENLRTVLARETRKAQAANDGNMVHALTVVRSELEKMPLLNETGEAKVLADKARSLAKAQFDLLDKKRPTYNPLYADVMNGAADTKDFIQKTVFNSKNKDFIKAIETLSDDPQAIQHLRSGALDFMIRNSTDASGNFATAKFNKFVNNLDVNKKLDVLFGDEAKTIRAIAETGKLIEARPKGAFVNESGTGVMLAPIIQHYGSEFMKKIPGAETAVKIHSARKTAKEVRETTKPGAGIKLKDIGKK